MRIAASTIRTHRRRARPARQSSAARRCPSRLPVTAIAPVTNTWTYNRRRLPTAETQAPDGTRSWSLTYGYNAQGLRTSETAPDNVTTTYTVNALGQTTQIKVKVKNATTTVASNASYYPNGALKQFTYGNGITHTLTQNTRQLPQHSQDGSVLDLTTTFDANGNVAAIVDGTASARQSRSMAYDGLDRLTQVQSPMFGTASYGYDEQDNLRHVAISGGSQPRDHTYCYSTDNRLEFVRSGPNCTGSASPAVIALGYDPQGNLQYKNGTAYTFDYGNRLRGTAGRSYRYDAAGRRVRTDSAGSQLQYSDYASDGRLVWQRDEAAGKRINNIYLAGSLVAEVSRSLTTDATTYRYIHTDALGSPIAKTSSTGAVVETSEYEPYGQLLNRANDDRAGYTGHVMDSASGLIYMQARYYDPQIGKHLSRDAVTAYDSGDMRHFNAYAYANNNPYRFMDPDGRKAKAKTASDKPRTEHEGTSQVGDPNAVNCHSYSWHDSKGDPTDPLNQKGGTGPNWDQSPLDDMRSDGVQLSPDEPNQLGDIVLYGNDLDGNGRLDQVAEIDHSATVTAVDAEGNTIRVESKEGDGSVWDHHPYDQNPQYGPTIEWWRKRHD